VRFVGVRVVVAPCSNKLALRRKPKIISIITFTNKKFISFAIQFQTFLSMIFYIISFLSMTFCIISPMKSQKTWGVLAPAQLFLQNKFLKFH